MGATLAGACLCVERCKVQRSAAKKQVKKQTWGSQYVKNKTRHKWKTWRRTEDGKWKPPPILLQREAEAKGETYEKVHHMASDKGAAAIAEKQLKYVNHDIPEWITVQRWNKLAPWLKCRSLGYIQQVYHENGLRAYHFKYKYTIEMAIQTLIGMNKRVPQKCDAVFSIFIGFWLNPSLPDEQLRVQCELPHGTGKKIKIAVYCPDDEEEEVMNMGAAICGKTLADQLAEGKISFDVMLAKAQMMPRLAKLGRLLGPKKLMPSPKSGTVVKDYKAAIDEYSKGNKIEIRTAPRSANCNCVIGKISMGEEKLIENFRAVLQQIADGRPKGANPKKFWRRVKVCASSTPALKIKPVDFPEIIAAADSDDSDDE